VTVMTARGKATHQQTTCTPHPLQLSVTDNRHDRHYPPAPLLRDLVAIWQDRAIYRQIIKHVPACLGVNILERQRREESRWPARPSALGTTAQNANLASRRLACPVASSTRALRRSSLVNRMLVVPRGLLAT
jgi:hypothetical protein